MFNAAKIHPLLTGIRYFGPAEVLRADTATDTVQVRLPQRLGSAEAWARIAIAGAVCHAGDEVLIAGETDDQLFVIGQLSPTRKSTPEVLDLDQGASARRVTTAEGDRLQVYSKCQELLFDYDPATEKARLHVSQGDLELASAAGNITLNAARNIRLNGQGVVATTRLGLRLGVLDAVGRLCSTFAVGVKGVKLQGPSVNVQADRGDVQIKAMRYAGDSVKGNVKTLHWVAERIDTLAQTVNETARNVYRSVEQLSQLKVGRLRTLVASAYHLKAAKVRLKAEADCKVNAEKIHLG